MRWIIVPVMLLLAPGGASAAKNLLLVGCGPDGHPPATHEYMAGLNLLKKCLEEAPDVKVTVVKAMDAWKDGPELMGRADGIVFFVSEGARWLAQDTQRMEAVAQVAKRKGGLVVLHWGMGTKDAKHIDGFLKLFGGCHGGPDRKYAVVETEVKIADRDHPIARGLPEKFSVKEEFYYRLKVVKPEADVKPIVRATLDGQDEMVGWAWQRPDGGRSFGFSGLHFHDNWRREEYRRLIAQGVLWTLDVPIPARGLAVKVKEEDLKLP
jgi:type 1 glutamine amidotransferase